MYDVGFIVGSLSEESINRRLAAAIGHLAGDRMRLTEIEIGDLPVYNRDLDDDLPGPAKRLKDQIEGADAVLFITPEYNRSVPAALTNAIEWASRPFGERTP
ncbi:NADPH-dependent FMN reductase [Sanguibacter sp. Z1732]|uniref:NADPH-dependent FMN reductase n=1 Tax=Sanguibacter sp. Z1732 TaxID=3435412 RepID=UPI003D9C8A80